MYISVKSTLVIVIEEGWGGEETAPEVSSMVQVAGGGRRLNPSQCTDGSSRECKLGPVGGLHPTDFLLLLKSSQAIVGCGITTSSHRISPRTRFKATCNPPTEPSVHLVLLLSVHWEGFGFPPQPPRSWKIPPAEGFRLATCNMPF